MIYILYIFMNDCPWMFLKVMNWRLQRYHNYHTCAQPTSGANFPSVATTATLLQTCLLMQL